MHLQLESAKHGTFNLNDVLMTGTGVQALSGATGLGLPQVAAQWLESAGDGAVFRGRRVLPRDIDLPLYFKGLNRTDLIAKVSKLAKMLSDECTLRFVNDDGTSWWTKVHHVGGGDYVYGEDTIGEDDLKMVLTLRAGNPFWRSGASVSVTQNLVDGAGTEKTLITVGNPGDVDAAPVFKFYGPLPNGVKISRNYFSVVDFTGPVWSGQTLTIDFGTGKVFDQDGISRYSELASSPTFFKIPPGGDLVTLDFRGDLPVPGSRNAEGGLLRNHITNPGFNAGNAGWDLANLTTPGAPSITMTNDSTIKRSGAASLRLMPNAGYSTALGGARFKFTGLDPSKFYGVTASCYANVAAKPSTTNDNYLPKLGWCFPKARTSGGVWFGSSYTENFSDCYGIWQTVTVPTAAHADPDGNLDVMLIIPMSYQNGVLQPYNFDNVYVWEADPKKVGAPFLGSYSLNQGPPYALNYFDGSSVVPDFSFWWEGAANASTSSGERTVTSGQAKVDVTLEPQRWAVV